MKGDLIVVAYDIDWETDGEKVDLPKEVLIPDHIAEEYLEMDAEAPGCADEILTDYLSDRYGWLINGFMIDIDRDYLIPEKNEMPRKRKRF